MWKTSKIKADLHEKNEKKKKKHLDRTVQHHVTVCACVGSQY